MNRELRLVFACLAAASKESERGEVRSLLSEAIDWEQFIELVQIHDVVTPCIRCLATFESSLPNAAYYRLYRAYEEAQANSAAYIREFGAILKDFQNSWIEAIPYKGPVFPELVWGDARLGEIERVNFVLHQEDVVRVQDGLQVRGFVSLDDRGHEGGEGEAPDERRFFKPVRVGPPLEFRIQWRLRVSSGVTRVLSFGLWLVHGALETDLPEKVLGRLRSESIVKRCVPEMRARFATDQWASLSVMEDLLTQADFANRVAYLTSLFRYVFFPDSTLKRRRSIPVPGCRAEKLCLS